MWTFFRNVNQTETQPRAVLEEAHRARATIIFFFFQIRITLTTILYKGLKINNIVIKIVFEMYI